MKKYKTWTEIKRTTDLYEQAHPEAPYLFVERRRGKRPIEAAQDFAQRLEAEARILHNLPTCDVWSLEPESESSPYRIATVWRSPDEDGKIEPAAARLEVNIPNFPEKEGKNG